MITATAVLGLSAVALGFGSDESWTQWRGPDNTGFAPDSNPPTTWTETENVRWKVAIPGQGHATPIVLGDRVYVITAVKTDREIKPAEGESPAAQPDNTPPPAETRRRRGRRGRGMGAPKPTNVYEFRVLAVDRNSGSIVWNTKVREEVPHEGMHRTSTFASNSPVTDGKHVYASFGSRGIFCLDLAGNVKWEKDLGDMQIRMSFGEGASPALHGDTLVVPWDHEGDSFVVALDKSTGEEKWRTSRNERTTWSTPVIVEVNGRHQVVIAGTEATVSYDLQSGQEIWRCSGMTNNVVPTPVVGHGMIYLISGFRGAALQAVKLTEAKGDITGTAAIVWSHDRDTPYIPSPMLSGERLYFLKGTNGQLSCHNAITGEEHYGGERLEAIGNVYASPVGAGGHVYICDREGNVVVLKDGPALEIVATNSLGEGINASPAIVGDEMFVRGDDHLYCIAKTVNPGKD
jgi:outer membrane protein assembly factor BamB